MVRKSRIVVALAVLAASPALAQEGQAVTLPDSAAAHWTQGPPDLPKGTMISLLMGDPSKPGPFVLRVLFPANTIIAPHTHSKPETVTVLSGDIYHEHGATLDKTKGEELHTGGFVYLPENMPHALWTTGAPVEIQVSGSGPFGLNYVNPKDDPSKS